MPRELFDRELAELRDEVLILGSMAEKALVDAIEALVAGDLAASQQIVENDLQINAKRFEIEDKALFAIATQQPIAADLREIVSVLYIITDLERIADHAEGTAKINLLMAGSDILPRKLGFIPLMAEKSQAMLRDTLKAYIEDDLEEARRICDADDEVDALQDRVYEERIQAMIDEPAAIEHNTHVIWAAHNLERIADRCTNICERIIFKVTGRMEEINVSKY
jgi:phosphate transport system protein